MSDKITKITYSKKEKILRAICYIGIIISYIIGILMFFIGKITGGIIILFICTISIFLMSSFIINKVKIFLNGKNRKKLALTLFYIAIILIAMLTTFIISFTTSLPYDNLIDKTITYTNDKIDSTIPNATIKNTEIFDGFEVGDSYYLALETEYIIEGIGGASSTHYSVTYIKINKITGTISETDFKSYETARTYS